jgi:L-cysteine S-thiosulfotransferase
MLGIRDRRLRLSVTVRAWLAIGVTLLAGVAASHAGAQTKPQTPASPRLASAAPSVPTPEQDRAALTSTLQKRFPALAIDDWSLGSAAFSPGVAVIPLGGANATNVNDILAIGKKAWERPFANGKSLATCFPNGGRRVASNYPQWDPQQNRVVTLEDAINACRLLHGELPFRLDDGLTMGAVSAYLRSLAVGQKLNVRVPPGPARAAYASGREWFGKRLGEKDMACASCHVQQAGGFWDEADAASGKRGLSPAVGQVLAWPRVEAGGRVRSLHQQFQRCMTRTGAEPFASGSPMFAEIEYFLASASNGLTIRGAIPTH